MAPREAFSKYTRSTCKLLINKWIHIYCCCVGTFLTGGVFDQNFGNNIYRLSSTSCFTLLFKLIYVKGVQCIIEKL